MDEINKEIERVAADIFTNNCSFDLLDQEQISELLGRGAAIQRNFDYLYRELSKFPELIMPQWVKGADICWFGFPISVKSRRAELIDYLDRKGIETRTMFTGNVTRHPAYKDSVYRISGELKEADWILEHSLWFTVHPRYTPKDLEYIVNTFKSFYK